MDNKGSGCKRTVAIALLQVVVMATLVAAPSTANAQTSTAVVTIVPRQSANQTGSAVTVDVTVIDGAGNPWNGNVGWHTRFYNQPSANTASGNIYVSNGSGSFSYVGTNVGEDVITAGTGLAQSNEAIAAISWYNSSEATGEQPYIKFTSNLSGTGRVGTYANFNVQAVNQYGDPWNGYLGWGTCFYGQPSANCAGGTFYVSAGNGSFSYMGYNVGQDTITFGKSLSTGEAVATYVWRPVIDVEPAPTPTLPEPTPTVIGEPQPLPTSGVLEPALPEDRLIEISTGVPLPTTPLAPLGAAEAAGSVPQGGVPSSLELIAVGAEQPTGLLRIAPAMWRRAMLKAATGARQLLKIIGQDDRTRVEDTTYTPARYTVSLIPRGANATACTGFLIDSDVVMTSAHCMFEGDDPTCSTCFEVVPGRNTLASGDPSPYGACDSRSLYAPKGYSDSQKDYLDYGFIVLDCHVGRLTGWFGWENRSSDWLHTTTRLRGYPGDKFTGTQWLSLAEVSGQGQNFLYYTNDSTDGMSGGPVHFVSSSYGRAVMAIHRGSASGWPDENQGIRINDSVARNINAMTSNG